MSEPMSPTPPPPGPPPAGGGGYQPPSVPGRPGLPWERSKDLNSLIATAKLLITSPGAAYAQAKEKGDYASPLIFAIVFWVIGAIFQAVWSLLRFGTGMGMLENMGDIPPEMQEMLRTWAAPAGAGSIVLGILLSPIIALVFLFIWSAIVHLVLKLVGGLNDSAAGFEGTLRGLSYSAVAQVAQVVPIVGPWICMIWSIVLQIIGLASLHRTSQGKAVMGVLIPIALCCVCIVLAIFVFAATIAAMIGGAAAGAN